MLDCFARVWTAANNEVEFPRIDLTPVFRVAAALVAVIAIVVAGFTAWQSTRGVPDAERPSLVASRDHHPPVGRPAPPAKGLPADVETDYVSLAPGLEDEITAQETGDVAGAPAIDSESRIAGDAVGEPEDELVAVLPPIPSTSRRPEIPQATGIPIRPDVPDRTGTQPLWLANAVLPRHLGDGPMIAIVIDDAGVAQARTARALDLPAPLTFAFIPYSDNLERQTDVARGRGHELLLHIPMEPASADIDPGHNALLASLGRDEIMRRFRWALDRFDGYVGVNNHMGSKFMARGDLVKPVLEEIKSRGLLFLDSRTDHKSSGTRLARDLGMPHATRNVFIDNDLDADKIKAQLAEVERVARRRGHAIAIGHPHDVTTETLAKWIPEARARGFLLVPVSTIVKKEYGPRLAAVSSGGEAEGLLGGAQ